MARTRAPLTAEYSPDTCTFKTVPQGRGAPVTSTSAAPRGRGEASSDTTSSEGVAKRDDVDAIHLFISAGAQALTAREVLDQLQEALGVVVRLRSISDRIGAGVEETLNALSTLASRTPAAEPSAGSLTTAEEDILREAGSLTVPMPPLESRASAVTSLAAVRLLEDAATVKETAERLGVSAGRVRQRLTERTLLGIETSGGWKLPLFQFASDGGEARGLDRVLQALPHDVHPLVAYRFLTRPTSELPVGDVAVSPIEWLTTGGSIDRVVALAEQLHSLP
jgi:hypothetical protein